MSEVELAVALALLGVAVGGLLGSVVFLRWEIRSLRWEMERLVRWQKILLEAHVRESTERTRAVLAEADEAVARSRAARDAGGEG